LSIRKHDTTGLGLPANHPINEVLNGTGPGISFRHAQSGYFHCICIVILPSDKTAWSGTGKTQKNALRHAVYSLAKHRASLLTSV
jgi:hypothetical protein